MLAGLPQRGVHAVAIFRNLAKPHQSELLDDHLQGVILRDLGEGEGGKQLGLGKCGEE